MLKWKESVTAPSSFHEFNEASYFFYDYSYISVGIDSIH